MPIWYRIATFLGSWLIQGIPAQKGKWKLMQQGQREVWDKLAAFKKQYPQPPFWFHCASLGEFEQAKPVLLALREQHTDTPIVVTFFSPSGYEARKTFAHAELICYLPLDAPRVAKRWVTMLQPKAVFWVKYEFWLGFLQAVKQSRTPLFLLAALPKAKYFKGLSASYYTLAYSYFNRLFVQYPELVSLLPMVLQNKAVVTGDPRYDNVLAGVAKAAQVPELEAFCKSSTKPVLLVGSAWQSDMDVLLPALQTLGHPYRLVIFPHEMHPEFLQYLQNQSSGGVSFWSQGVDFGADVLVVDQVGFLSRAYAYADIAWVGGGFDKGLHNILEAAAWGKPVMHGPKTDYFPEARRLGGVGGGFAVKDSVEATSALQRLLVDETRQQAGIAARHFVESEAGATARILASVAIDS